MKQVGQNRYYAQVWMCLVMKVKPDAAKNSIIQEPGIDPWIREKLDVVKEEMVRINILGIAN